MWIGMLCIFGCYGASIIIMHLLLGARKGSKKPTTIVLVTKNNQSQIEWVIRSLFFFSKVKGSQVTATVFDEGSSDDTQEIVERLSQTYAVELRVQFEYDAIDRFLSQHEDDPVVIVHLSNREEAVKIPVL
ncbi:hypothetical protein [Paenibacillus roseipurpureus]|uniref:Uncharacterized protein n=1 Tax=Paenibacillus roseopurpureus TaxID=2918901 RepID=A0AA96LMW7_9BACL|nr:hypothetical protein [Paenibacillus sp. MBLB1832]WNR44685.1 hypothetical protein MJB10_00520 [Paenibacillus sp. MBLB1832]